MIYGAHNGTVSFRALRRTHDMDSGTMIIAEVVEGVSAKLNTFNLRILLPNNLTSGRIWRYSTLSSQSREDRRYPNGPTSLHQVERRQGSYYDRLDSRQCGESTCSNEERQEYNNMINMSFLKKCIWSQIIVNA